MSESNPLQPGQRFANGRFVLIRFLGRGGMGEVWLAQDERLNESVALKFLPAEIRGDPVALDNLRRETARSHKLTHPNIVRIHDLHEDPDGTAFIVMECIDGPTLAALRLQQPNRVFEWNFLRSLLEQLCAALDYAHSEKVIHRDLKPANMMADSRGRLKLADFGIAAVASDSMSRVSAQHTTSGTLLYMRPQQLAGTRPQATDDIYALGATIYELLTSQPPFHTGDLTHQILHEAPEPMEERLAALEIQNSIPPDVSAMIMACLAKEPGRRPQSALGVAEWIGLEVVRKPSTENLSAALFPQAQSSPAAVAGKQAANGRSTPARFGRKLAAVGMVALLMAGALWLGKGFHRSNNSNGPDQRAAWLPLDITAACNADILSTDSHKAANQFTFNGGTLASASWLRKYGFPEPGIPDDGRVEIPDGKPAGVFQMQMPPARNVILITGPQGPQPQPVTVDLPVSERRSYSELALLYATCWGNGILRVDLRYDSGVETSATISAIQYSLKGRVAPLPHDLHLAATSRDTHPQFGSTAEIFSGRIQVNPQWKLSSLTFSFGSLELLRDSSPQTQRRFTIGIFAVNALYGAKQAQDKQSLPPEGHTKSSEKTPPSVPPEPAATASGTVPAAYPNAPATANLKRGLVLYYSFDEPAKDGVVRDQSGLGNDGQVVGAKWTAEGRSGGGLVFSPPDCYIRVPNSDSLNPANLTLAAWIKTSNQGDTWRRVFDKSWTHGYALSIGGGHTPGNKFQSRATIEIGMEVNHNKGFCASDEPVTDGRWHHLAVTYNGAEEILYVDGVPQRRMARWKGKVPANSHDLTLGMNLIDPNPKYNEVVASFDGVMDEPMIFNRALSPEEIRQLYEAPGPPPAAANPAPARIGEAGDSAARQLRYGLYIHFGVATFARADDQGPVPAGRFSPAALNAHEWVRVARDAGMTFAILTAKHESGFCLWDSPDDDYDVGRSPFKRDLIAEFVAACKAGGLVPGVHYSIRDTYNEGSLRHSGKISRSYFEVIKKHIAELQTRYPDLRMLILDVSQRLSSAQFDELRQLAERLNPRCAIWDTTGAAGGPCHVATTVISSWMWAPNSSLNPAGELLQSYKNAQTAGKAFVLNVGPDQTGRIPDEQVAVLMDLKRLIAEPAR